MPYGTVHLRVHHNDFPRLAAAMPSKTRAIVARTALGIEAAAKGKMGGPSPSAPGSPPAIDTGVLVNSIRASQDTPTRWRVVVGAEYGLYLEFGTIRMAPRPFFIDTVEKAAPPFRAAIAGLFS